MISVTEAQIFIENILGIPKTWKSQCQEAPMEFLRTFMLHHARRIPFQNVTMTAIDPLDRHNPCLEELASQGMSGVGGCCINLNYFAHFVFQAIGLDSWVIQGTHDNAPVAGTHCMVIVKLPQNGGMYLVEVGGSFPILEPVPMDAAKLPFKILCAGGFPYDFRVLPQGDTSSSAIIGRYNVGGGIFGGKYVGKTEALRTSWDLVPRVFHEFDYPMIETFTNPPNANLLRIPMMYRYFYPEEARKFLSDLRTFHPESKVDTEYDGEDDYDPSEHYFIFAYKRQITIGNTQHRKYVVVYDAYLNDMENDISKYFPMLDPTEVKKACEAWNEFGVAATPYDHIL